MNGKEINVRVGELSNRLVKQRTELSSSRIRQGASLDFLLAHYRVFGAEYGRVNRMRKGSKRVEHLTNGTLPCATFLKG